MKTKLVILCLLLPLGVFAQQSKFEDRLLDHMVGHWVLKGVIAGQQTTHDVTVEWVLAHQYLQLHEISQEKDSAGHPAYEALVFIGWDQSINQYACLWLDITGSSGLTSQAIAHAPRSADTLAFLFKGGDGSLFHTTFIYDEVTDTWQWLMDGEENGKLQPFARVILKRE